MKYVCSICGYVYDDTKEEVKFEDLPDTWVCPWCGASKSLFKPLEEEKNETENIEENEVNVEEVELEENVTEENEEDTIEKLSIGQLSALCSNLARGCQKQYKFEEEKLFNELATYLSKVTPSVNDSSVEELSKMMLNDLDEKYVNADKVAHENEDRGALRALVWGSKVTRMINSLIDKYKEDGEKMFEDSEVWLCTTCGFIYIGKNPPLKCPVCKVPSSKFEKIEGRK